MRKMLIGTLVAGSLAITNPAHAQWGGWGYGGYGGWGYGGAMIGAAAGGALIGGLLGSAIANANRPVYAPAPVYVQPAPVVVEQSAPVVVQQPAPVIVEQRPVVIKRRCQTFQEWDALQGYVYRKVC